MPLNIGRREFIAVLGSAAASSLSARAQQLPGRTARIGLLQTSRDNPVVERGYPAFLDELKKSGFSAGQNLTIEVVRTDQDSQRLFAETADLVRSNVELLVAEGTEIVLKAALAASRTIPIVISAINYDPIARGYVTSLARPGGNITGIVSLQTELAAKQVELLEGGLSRQKPTGRSL
jgi:putative ABC transport system substrate-binding protein